MRLKLASRKPDSVFDERTKPMAAMCRVEYRRRALIEKLCPGDRDAYARRLDKLGELLSWDEFRIGDAPKAKSMAESLTVERESAKMFHELMKTRDKMGVFNPWSEKYHNEANDDAKSGMSRVGLALREDWRIKHLKNRIRREGGGKPDPESPLWSKCVQ